MTIRHAAGALAHAEDAAVEIALTHAYDGGAAAAATRQGADMMT